MSLRQRAVRGVLWSGLQIWGSNLVSMLVVLVLARLLVPEDFGLVALASTFSVFLAIFLRQGFSQALVQRSELEPGHLDTAFWISVLSGVVLTAIGVAIAAPAAILFHEPRLAPVIRWLSLNFLISGFSGTQQALFQRRLAFKALAFRSLVGGVVGGGVGIAMALAGFGVWSLVAQMLLGNLAGTLLLWLISDWRPGIKLSVGHARELFSFGINVMGIEVLGFASRRSADLLIGYFLGPVALGYYTIAYELLWRMTQILTATISSVALPTFSRLQAKRDQMRQAFYTATQMTSLIAFPAFFSMAALAPELINALFGAQWSPSIPVMRILSFVGVLYSVYFFNAPAIMASGKPSWVLAIAFANAVTNICFFIAAVRWGIVGVASAYVLRGYLLSPLHLWALAKLIDLSPTRYLRQFARPLGGSLVMVVAVLLARHLLSPWVGTSQTLLAICLGTGVAVYVLFVLLFAPALSSKAIELARLALPMETSKKA